MVAAEDAAGTVWEMEIRQPTVWEAEALARLYRKSAEHHVALDSDSYQVPDMENIADHYRERLTQPDDSYACFVADVDGDVAGMVETSLAGQPPPHSMLRPQVMATAGIVVAPEHRRRGIGSALMHRAEEWATEQGCSGVMLDMLGANEPALAFYRGLGYEDFGMLLVKRQLSTPDRQR